MQRVCYHVVPEQGVGSKNSNLQSFNDLQPRSPNLNVHCERWIRSVKNELLSKVILFGESSLRHCLENYVNHFHAKRNHQGKGNVILFPAPEDRIGEIAGDIQTRERLGGLLKFYYRNGADLRQLSRMRS